MDKLQPYRDIRLLPSKAQELAYSGGWRLVPQAYHWQNPQKWRDFTNNDYFHVAGRGVEHIFGVN